MIRIRKNNIIISISYTIGLWKFDTVMLIEALPRQQANPDIFVSYLLTPLSFEADSISFQWHL